MKKIKQIQSSVVSTDMFYLSFNFHSKPLSNQIK